MNRKLKKELKTEVLISYKQLMHPLYKKYCHNDITSDEIKLEVLNIIQEHIHNKILLALKNKRKNSPTQKLDKIISMLVDPKKEIINEELSFSNKENTLLEI